MMKTLKIITVAALLVLPSVVLYRQDIYKMMIHNPIRNYADTLLHSTKTGQSIN
ncbi:hypothetical protein [Sporosarcina aquimarina]|uniref:Uncharacterized protein n=1 Tax=Sporosarcina aquimarina TaxID=114975 RepID=A0ABU4FYA6_9BACL|nr:hypothetical protein [Sporosarcina aquimarina]MDW0109708.1 hypothetical protein [Sporosarcina aquimarina]